MKGQELPISTLIIIALGITVLVSVVVMILVYKGGGESSQEGYWNLSFNLSNEARTEKIYPEKQCAKKGQICDKDEDCCDYPSPSIKCYPKESGGIKTCNNPATIGEYCPSTEYCEYPLICNEEHICSSSER